MPNTHRRRRRDETVLSRRVASRRRWRCAHEFATSSRRLPTDSIDNLKTGQTDSVCVCFCVCLTTRILIDTDNFFNSDDIMTSLLKKLSIFIKIGVIKRYGVCLVSFKIADRISRQSSSAANCVHTADADAKKNSFVASAVCSNGSITYYPASKMCSR